MSSSAALAGRGAIVTGASQGLGREIARHFLDAGADVALCARAADELAAAAASLRAEFPGRRVLARPVDVARPEQLDDFFAETLDGLGRLDVVVNNAGVHGPIGPIDAVDWLGWEHAIAINLLGTVYSCRCAVRCFKSRPPAGRHRKIINLSGGGATAPQPGLSAYGTSKAAVVRFTETLAEEVRPHAIDANAVAPGALATRLMRELRQAGPERIGERYHRQVEELHARGGMPLARAAELCVYLASPASDGVTGRLISAAWDPWPFSPQAAADIMGSDIYALRRIVPRDRGRDWGDAR